MATIVGSREIAKTCGDYAPERRKVEVSIDGEALQAKFAAIARSCLRWPMGLHARL